MVGTKALSWCKCGMGKRRLPGACGALILEADPKMIEEQKWKKPSNAMAGIPVWSHNGIVCTGETYAKVVKLTFARGASIPDPSRSLSIVASKAPATSDRNPRRREGRRGGVSARS